MSKGCSEAPGDSNHIMKEVMKPWSALTRQKFYFQLSSYSLLTSINRDFLPFVATIYVIVLHEIFQIKKKFFRVIF